MNHHPLPFLSRSALSATALLLSACAAVLDVPASPHLLTGMWTLVAADAIKPDGSRVRDYGDAPRGMLFVDAKGHYSLQIFKAERPRFASTSKVTGTAAEYESAVMGSSTHFGDMDVDLVAHTLTFSISASSFPNWEGTKQVRSYELKDDVLSYRVPPRADGSVPVSVWKRVR
jgi:hypothetical protein